MHARFCEVGDRRRREEASSLLFPLDRLRANSRVPGLEKNMPGPIRSRSQHHQALKKGASRLTKHLAATLSQAQRSLAHVSAAVRSKTVSKRAEPFPKPSKRSVVEEPLATRPGSCLDFTICVQKFRYRDTPFSIFRAFPPRVRSAIFGPALRPAGAIRQAWGSCESAFVLLPASRRMSRL
jgi:hypothetical protein